MRNILLIISFIFGVSCLMLAIYYRGTPLHYLFILLYGLSGGFFIHEINKKTGIKNIKKPVRIRLRSYVAVSFVLAGLVFCVGSLLNVDMSVKILSTVGTLFICGILTLLYSIHIVKKDKQ